MLRRLTVTAVVTSVVLAAAGCLTPLTSQPPLAPVPASLLAGAVNLATGGGQLFRKLTVFLVAAVAAVAVLLLLGLVRAITLLRRGTGASWRDAIGAFFISWTRQRHGRTTLGTRFPPSAGAA